MGAPVLMGAGVGALASLATGRDPLKGAALGGVTGGAFGGSTGFGSGFTEGGLFNLGSALPSATESAVSSAGGATAFGAQQAPNAMASQVATAPVATVQPSIMPGSLESSGMVEVGGTYYPEGSLATSGLIENPDIPGQFIDSAAYQRLNKPSLFDTASSALNTISPQDAMAVGTVAMDAMAKNEQPQMGMQTMPIIPAKQPSLGRPLAVNVAQQRKRPVFYG